MERETVEGTWLRLNPWVCIELPEAYFQSRVSLIKLVYGTNSVF